MIADIIRKYNDRDSLYGDKLTNHLNMGLYALYKMGANEKRLHDFAERYISNSKLPLLASVEVKISEDNFYDYLGVDGYYSSYIPFFQKELKNTDTDAVLKRYVNILIKGAAGGAFHGLIRLAYAYELNEIDELAKALAYFAEAYQEFPISDETKESIETIKPIDGISALSENAYFQNFEFSRPLIIGRMLDIYEDPEFCKVITQISDEYCTSEYFSELLLELYGRTGDFTILHGFTSTHALRILKRFITDYKSILKQQWFLLQLAYLSTKCAAINEFPNLDSVKSWQDIFKDACKSEDVHTIKLVYSLFEQSKLSDDDLKYRTVAFKKIYNS